MKFTPRGRKPMILVDKGEFVAVCETDDWCLDAKIPYVLDGKKGEAWLRSQTWIAREMVRGRRTVAQEKVDALVRTLPKAEALIPE